jgi:hypothetical protein
MSHLRPKTWQNYEYGKRKLKRWLRASGRVLTVSSFLDFMADCRRAGLSYHVPNFARSWLAFYEKVTFNRQIITGSFRVKMALEGYKRVTPREYVRHPIHLNMMVKLLKAHVPIAMRLCFLLSYAFLLRVSEVMDIMMGKGSVEKVDKGWIIFLQQSKADPVCLLQQQGSPSRSRCAP